ncbi:MAG: hypothetical protein LBV41_07835 [Cytophagaceae bacterium]|jgi:hypothetical protein|nr:hypothetical protein [Cytophagaceae bacterium]
MKKIFFNVSMILCIAVVVAFASCEKNIGNRNLDDGMFFPIKATVENGNGYNEKINAVKALLPQYETDTVITKSGSGTIITTSVIGIHALASTPYGNGKFTINLPNVVDSKYFLNPFEIFEFREDGATISAPSVKMATLPEFTAYRDAVPSGYILHSSYVQNKEKEPVTGYDAIFLYADRDVDITGEDRVELNENDPVVWAYRYSLSIKKGWNIVYYFAGNIKDANPEKEIITTVAPEGMKWYYYEYSVQPKSLIKSKSIFDRLN